MELSARDIRRAKPVERGTVIMTISIVFFRACMKYGSCRTKE